MAHFAKLDDNNIVISVHVIDNSIINIDGNEIEELGINFLTNLHGHSKWKQTSYSNSFRKNYASIGYSYDEERDAFIAPKIYNSWILNENTCQWESPVPYPRGESDDSIAWAWDDNLISWVDEKELIYPETGVANV